jgi:prophage regulatory protein
MTSTETTNAFTRPETAISDTLLRLSDVEAIAGFKKSKIYQLVAEGRFPKPLHLGKRSIRWKGSQIKVWIDNLGA